MTSGKFAPLLAAVLITIPNVAAAAQVYEKLASGQTIYRRNCAMCHGNERRGNPPSIPSLLGIEKRATPLDIVERIHLGKGGMPAFPQLQGPRLESLLRYLGVHVDPEIVAVAGSEQYLTIPAAKPADLTPSIPIAYDLDNWPRSNGDASSTRYSRLDQVNVSNVRNLRVAWIYHSHDGRGNIEANPVIVNGVMYAPTVGHHIVAINAETGKELWRFEADGVPAQRGLIYWPGNRTASARLFFTAGNSLYALDPKSGRPISTFGENGEVRSGGVVAPAVYKNIIVVPDQNVIEAFDAVSGKSLWKFRVMPHGKPQPADAGGNCWGGMAMDESRGIAYISTGSPHPNFDGTGHLGRDRYANSVIALDAVTGKLRWSFQEIRHDIWDLDIPAPPILVTVMRDGRRVDAVAQVTKLGNTLLLDRTTGKPLFPFRLKRAPRSNLPGEQAWPYQPDLELPEPFSRQVFSAADVTNLTPKAHTYVMNLLKRANYGWFEPFEQNRPTAYYGIHGGAEWTGASFDPATGWLYVSANQLAWIITVVPKPGRESTLPASVQPGRQVFLHNCALCHGNDREGRGMAPPLLNLRSHLSREAAAGIVKNGRNSMPPISLSATQLNQVLDYLFYESPRGSGSSEAGRRYTFEGYKKLLDDRGYPGTKPPWGTLNAINLNTGRIAWKRPLGEYLELKAAGVEQTGTENFGGATVTAGGLVFCAGTRDHEIRAFNKENGKELWSYKLPYGGYAPPAIYAAGGREYIVIAATGGGKLGGPMGDAYVAFSLSRAKK